MQVPALLSKFEDLLFRYHEDYKSDALLDDLKKEAIKELIPKALETTVKDIIMFRNMKEDTLNSAQMHSIIMERISSDVMNQVIRMDVDNVEGWLHPSAPGRVDDAAPAEQPPDYNEEWANSLGYLQKAFSLT